MILNPRGGKYKVNTTVIEATVSGLNHHLFQVINNDDGKLIALCPTVAAAQQVAHSLNFTTRPRDYGYVLEEDDYYA